MQILWRLKLIKTFFTLKSNYKSLDMELLTLLESSWVYYVMATHPISLSGFFQSVKQDNLLSDSNIVEPGEQRNNC